jgi:hypothetical protein
MTEILKYKDKEYPYRVSFRALAALQRETKKNLNDALAQLDDINVIVIFLYHSLQQGHKDEGIKMHLKKDDCFDLLEDGNFEKFIESVGSFFLKLEGEKEEKSQG